MKLSEAFNLYKKAKRPSTVNEHSRKIQNYIDFMDDCIITDELAFSKEYLELFVYNKDQKALGKYNALRSFYEFIKLDIEHLPRNAFSFCIIKEDVDKFDKEDTDSEDEVVYKSTTYLPRGFDFKNLFLDYHYSHLKNERASKIIKAAIALGLAAGYDTGEMIGKRIPPKFNINDIQIVENGVKVKNYVEGSVEEWITIVGDLAQYVIEYYELRKTVTSLPKDEQNFFFVRLYDTYELGFDKDVSNTKPYTAQTLILYFLKYLSSKLNLDRQMYIKDLKCNMVLHSLYQSKGSSLHQIIKTFGYPPFVQNAFSKYCEEGVSGDENIIFGDRSFFQSTPLKNNDILDNSSGVNSDIIEAIITRRKRDSEPVKELKKLYNNVCQICGEPLFSFKGIAFSEACHIHPLCQDGIDHKTNMLILCPNHHTLFDIGAIAINPEDTKTLIHIDKNNRLNGTELKVILHKISSNYLRYHYENIYLPFLNKILVKDKNYPYSFPLG